MGARGKEKTEADVQLSSLEKKFFLSVSKSSIDRYLNRGMLKRINIKGTRLVRIDYSSIEQLLVESPQGVA